jgi:hypothetical protein
MCLIALAASPSVHALSAGLFNDNACARLLGTMTNIDSGACFAVDGLPRETYGQVVCTPDGQARIGLYATRACDLATMTGAGRGDGTACIILDGPYNAAAKVNCDAPGDVPSTAALSTGAIAGIAIACVVIALGLVAGAAWYWYRTRKAAFTRMHHPMAPAGPHTVVGNRQALPPGAMSIVLLALVCITSIPGAAAVSPIGDEDALMFQYIGMWTSILVGITMCIKCCIPGAFRAPPRFF